MLAELLGALLADSVGQKPQNSRPQGPGLNIGEASVRKQYGAPTTARVTQHATSKGRGSGQRAVNLKQAREAKIPKRFPGKKGDFTVDDVKFGMAGLRQAMGQPTTGRDVQETSLINQLSLPAANWDPSRDMWTSGDPREAYVQRRYDKWDPDGKKSFFGLFEDKASDAPRKSQREALRHDWGREYDKRYGGEGYNTAERVFAGAFGQDPYNEDFDEGSYALSMALMPLGGGLGKAGQGFKQAAATRKAFKPGMKAYGKETAARAGS